MAFNAILSSWDQNSYVSVEYADAYFLENMGRQQWSDLDIEFKQGSLTQASRLLDSNPTFGNAKLSLFGSLPYKQGLRLPLSDNTTIAGTADSGLTQKSFDDSLLGNSETLRNNLLVGGAIRITAGVNINEVQEIASNDVSASSVTVIEDWGAVPDNTSVYTLIYPLEDNFKNAVCEFALEIAKGQYGEVQEAIGSGAVPGANVTFIPARVRWMIPEMFGTQIGISSL